MFELIERAIAAGKFPPSRRAHYESKMRRDPERTARLIASLEPIPELRGLPGARRRGPIASDAGRSLTPHPFGGFIAESR